MAPWGTMDREQVGGCAIMVWAMFWVWPSLLQTMFVFFEVTAGESLPGRGEGVDLASEFPGPQNNRASLIWANMSDPLPMVQVIALWPWYQLPKNIVAQGCSGTTGVRHIINLMVIRLRLLHVIS